MQSAHWFCGFTDKDGKRGLFIPMDNVGDDPSCSVPGKLNVGNRVGSH
jgi:hypothetical protein